MDRQRRRRLREALHRRRDRGPARLAARQPSGDPGQHGCWLRGPLKGSVSFDKQISLRFIGQNLAIAISEAGIRFPGETDIPEERKANATWVFEKRNGNWTFTGPRPGRSARGLA